jgi:hypothetical protein
MRVSPDYRTLDSQYCITHYTREANNPINTIYHYKLGQPEARNASRRHVFFK